MRRFFCTGGNVIQMIRGECQKILDRKELEFSPAKKAMIEKIKNNPENYTDKYSEFKNSIEKYIEYESHKHSGTC